MDQIEVSGNGVTVWIHAPDTARPWGDSQKFGMDIHTSLTEQLEGAAECLHCTHTKPKEEDWVLFCNLIHKHYGITVSKDLVTF